MMTISEQISRNVTPLTPGHQKALEWINSSPRRMLIGEEWAVLESLDTGVGFASAVGRAAQVAEIFRYYAGWPTKIFGTTNPMDASRFQYMLREPMGVCGLINAWNVPLVMAANKIAPTL